MWSRSNSAVSNLTPEIELGLNRLVLFPRVKPDWQRSAAVCQSAAQGAMPAPAHHEIRRVHCRHRALPIAARVSLLAVMVRPALTAQPVLPDRSMTVNRGVGRSQSCRPGRDCSMIDPFRLEFVDLFQGSLTR